MQPNANPRGSGAILALAIIGGTVIGGAVGEPSIGLLAGVGVGIAIALLLWLRERKR